MTLALRWLVASLTVWYGSYLYLYAFKLGGPKPLYSYAVTALLLVGYLIHYERAKAGLFGAGASKRHLVFWLIVYLGYGCFAFLVSKQSSAAVQDVVTLMEAVILTCAFVLFMRNSRELKVAEACFAALAVAGSIMNFWDFVDPTFSNVPGRAAGLYENPTIAGAFLALAMVAGIRHVQFRARVAYVALVGLGVTATFSRGAWVIWGLGTVMLGWKGYLTHRSRVAAMVAGVLLGAGLTAGLLTGGLSGFISNSFVSDYLTPNTALRIGITGLSVSGNSTKERLDLVEQSIAESQDHMLFGHGLGYTREWSHRPHNMYLLFLVEGGLLGLTIYCWLMSLLWRMSAGPGSIVAVQIIAGSVFSHNHLEQPAILMMMAYVAATAQLGVARNVAHIRTVRPNGLRFSDSLQQTR